MTAGAVGARPMMSTSGMVASVRYISTLKSFGIGDDGGLLGDDLVHHRSPDVGAVPRPDKNSLPIAIPEK